MKYYNIIVLLIFLNITVLPGVASIFGWEISKTNIVLNEEECHINSFVLSEKTIPKTFDIHDFLKFYEYVTPKDLTSKREDNIYLSPYLSIFSPPPEA